MGVKENDKIKILNDRTLRPLTKRSPCPTSSTRQLSNANTTAFARVMSDIILSHSSHQTMVKKLRGAYDRNPECHKSSYIEATEHCPSLSARFLHQRYLLHHSHPPISHTKRTRAIYRVRLVCETASPKYLPPNPSPSHHHHHPTTSTPKLKDPS